MHARYVEVIGSRCQHWTCSFSHSMDSVVTVHRAPNRPNRNRISQGSRVSGRSPFVSDWAVWRGCKERGGEEG